MDATFDLVFSTFVSTEQRPFDRNRFERLDIFLWTLETYSRLRSLSRAFLCVELAPEYAKDIPRLTQKIQDMFGAKLKVLQWQRLLHRDEWRSLIFQVGAKDGSADDKIVWFIQNDDHPFVDFNEDVLEEGLNHLRDSSAQFRALYPSHWPEILNAVGKYSEPVVCGSYVKTNMTVTDGLQFMNFGFVRYIIDELTWTTESIRRTDSLLLDSRLWDAGTGQYDMTVLYVPLRELCRKFDGYQVQGISKERVPWLVLPPENNTFDRSVPAVLRMLTSDRPLETEWCHRNRFSLPPEFVGRIAELHLGDFLPSDTTCRRLSGDFCNAKQSFEKSNIQAD